MTSSKPSLPDSRATSGSLHACTDMSTHEFWFWVQSVRKATATAGMTSAEPSLLNSRATFGQRACRHGHLQVGVLDALSAVLSCAASPL